MNYQEHPRTRKLRFGPSSKANSFITEIKTSPRRRFQINDSGASRSLFFFYPDLYIDILAYFSAVNMPRYRYRTRVKCQQKFFDSYLYEFFDIYLQTLL